MRAAALSVVLLLSVSGAAQQTLLVPSQYATIQGAMNAAANGDAVLVSPGTYLEQIDFDGKNILVASTSGPDVTTIDAQQLGTTVSFISSEGPGAVLRGFRITGGSAGFGGGIHCGMASHATIENCRITGNHTEPGGGGGSSAGGGIAVIAGWAILRQCEIVANFASGSTNVGGGGIYISNSGLFLNVASSLVVENSTVQGNYCVNGSAPFGRGGGLLARGSGNVSVALSSCILANNSALTDGGIQADDDATVVQLTNCTIRGNAAANGGGVSALMSTTIVGRNCIICANTPFSVNSSSSVPIAFDHSNIEGGWPGVGNFDADPVFVDEANGDLHLVFGSPCIDSGSNGAAGITTFDIDGESRIIGSAIDIGADEFSATYLGPCAAGTLGATLGGPYDVLFINGSAGGAPRRVDVPMATPFTISVTQPPTNPFPSAFVIVGHIGVPDPADVTPLPFGIGTLCFPSPHLTPGDPAAFVLTNNFGPGAQLVSSTPTPWAIAVNGLPFPFQFALQGVIQQDPGMVKTTNGVLVNIQ